MAAAVAAAWLASYSVVLQEAIRAAVDMAAVVLVLVALAESWPDKSSRACFPREANRLRVALSRAAATAAAAVEVQEAIIPLVQAVSLVRSSAACSAASSTAR